jgi:hypothetical protein
LVSIEAAEGAIDPERAGYSPKVRLKDGIPELWKWFAKEVFGL